MGEKKKKREREAMGEGDFTISLLFMWPCYRCTHNTHITHRHTHARTTLLGICWQCNFKCPFLMCLYHGSFHFYCFVSITSFMIVSCFIMHWLTLYGLAYGGRSFKFSLVLMRVNTRPAAWRGGLVTCKIDGLETNHPYHKHPFLHFNQLPCRCTPDFPHFSSSLSSSSILLLKNCNQC